MPFISNKELNEKESKIRVLEGQLNKKGEIIRIYKESLESAMNDKTISIDQYTNLLGRILKGFETIESK